MYNLGRIGDQTMWHTHFYTFYTWSPGVCVTYNPPNKSVISPKNQLNVFLGNKKTRGDALDVFDIHLHEKDQFWPLEGMDKIGQSDILQVQAGHEIKGVFEVQEVTNFNKPGGNCEESAGYSFTECTMKYVEMKSKCAIDIKKTNNSCSNDEFKDYQTLLLLLTRMTPSLMMATTGCHSRCKVRKFTFIQHSSEVQFPLCNIIFENIFWKSKKIIFLGSLVEIKLDLFFLPQAT